MVNFQSTYPRCVSALRFYPQGLNGHPLESIRLANKAVRKIRDAAIDLEEALKVKQKEINALVASAEGDEARQAEVKAAKEVFEAEVLATNKTMLPIECQPDAARAFAEVLKKIDWSNKDLKDKFQTGDMLNVDEFIEEIEAAA